MKLFRPVIIATVVATYILIFIGGLVRVSGAGLGCPDWPRCYGGFVPPFTNSELHHAMANMPPAMVASSTLEGPDLDPSKFNVTLAWIEYLNRLCGVLVGALMLAAAALSLHREVRRQRGIVAAVWGSLVVVAFTGWLGKVVVQSNLHPLMVSIHLGGALVVVGLLLYAAWAAHAAPAGPAAAFPAGACAANDGAEVPVVAGPPPPWWLLGLWALTLVQLTLGADLRGNLDLLDQQNVGLTGVDLIRLAGGTKQFHMLLGLLLAGSGVAAVRTLGNRQWRALRNPVLLHLARLQMILLLAQVCLGFGFGMVGLFPLLRVFHLWIASLAAGGWLLLFLLARRAAATVPAPGPASPAALAAASRQQRALVLWTGGGAATAALLLLVAVVTVQQARAARNVLPVFGSVPAFHYSAWPGPIFDRQQLNGKITIASFMFTRCTTICPLLSQSLSDLHRTYAQRPEVQLISFTVDPTHDTLPVLAAYATPLGAGDNHWQFLSGPAAEVPVLARDGFLVSGDYPLHSRQLILIDAQGRIRGYYDGTRPAAVQQLKDHLQLLATQEGG